MMRDLWMWGITPPPAMVVLVLVLFLPTPRVPPPTFTAVPAVPIVVVVVSVRRQARAHARVVELPLELGHLHQPLLLQSHAAAPLPGVFPATVAHVQPSRERGEGGERIAVRRLEIEPSLASLARRASRLLRKRRLDRERRRERRRRPGETEQGRQHQELPRVDVHRKTRQKRAERSQRLRRRQRPVFL